MRQENKVKVFRLGMFLLLGNNICNTPTKIVDKVLNVLMRVMMKMMINREWRMLSFHHSKC